MSNPAPVTGLWRYRGHGQKFLVMRRDGSIPSWPYFVLGARDPAAAEAIRAYADICTEQGYNTDYTGDLLRLADDFDAYRARMGDGDPESPPHRTDCAAVLSLMEGAGITVLQGEAVLMLGGVSP